MAQLTITLPDGNTLQIDENDERLPAVREKLAGMSAEDKAKVQIVRGEAPSDNGISAARDSRQAALDARMERQQAKPRSGFSVGLERLTEGTANGQPAPVSPQEAAGAFGRSAENIVRSAAAPVGGDFVAGGSENLVRMATGQEVNPNAVAEQRARRQQLAQEMPAGAIAGEATGYFGLTKLLTSVFPFLNVGTAGSTVAKSNRVANAAKVASEAAAVTAIGEGAKGQSPGDIAKTAGVAAVAAPVLSSVIRGVTQGTTSAPGAVSSIAKGADDSGGISVAAVRAIAQRTGQSIDDIRLAADNFMRVNGRAPRLAEIVDEATIKRYRALATGRDKASDTLVQGEEAAARQRPVEMKAQIEQGVDTLSPEALTRARDTQLTNTLRNGTPNTPAVADMQLDERPFVQLFQDNPHLYDDLPTTLKRRVARALPAEDGTPGEEAFTVGLGEDIRLALSKKGGAGDAYKYTEGATELRDLLRQQSQAYDQAMDIYAKQSQFIDGFNRGAGVRTADTATVEQVTPTLTVPEQSGVAAGARGAIAQEAGKSPSAAVTQAKTLAESEDLGRKLTASVGEGEANRLRDIGQTQFKAATNLTKLSPKTELPPSLREASQSIAEVAASVTGRAGEQLRSRVAGQVLGRLRNLGVPPNAAVNMSRLILDPARTNEVLAKMVQIGIQEAQIQQFAQDVATMLSATGSDTGADIAFPNVQETTQ
jgi:hypothetical protein